MARGFGKHRAALDTCICASCLALASAFFALGHHLAHPTTKEHP